MGAEFYRWEFAIATAAAVMGVHPFNQPDVQRAKYLTGQFLDKFESDGLAPDLSPRGSLSDLVADTKQADYIAILAYIEQTPETDLALNSLRATITQRATASPRLSDTARDTSTPPVSSTKADPDSVALLMLTDSSRRPTSRYRERSSPLESWPTPKPMATSTR